MTQKTNKPKLLLLTFTGGAVGSILRYAMMLAFPQEIWLWIVNLLGALVLGYVQVNQHFADAKWQSLVGTGFAGGFTTLSSLITFGLLANEANIAAVGSQMAVGILFYTLGRYLGGSK